MFGAFHAGSPESYITEPEPSRVVGYRFQRLFEAGYDMADARLIARRMDVDLHYALNLIRMTADSELARRVVL